MNLYDLALLPLPTFFPLAPQKMGRRRKVFPVSPENMTFFQPFISSKNFKPKLLKAPASEKN